MDIVCACFDVTRNQIIEAVKNGATTVEAIGEVTNAGLGCGGCIPEIEIIIKEVIKS